MLPKNYFGISNQNIKYLLLLKRNSFDFYTFKDGSLYIAQEMRKILLSIFLLSLSLSSIAHLGPEKLKKRKTDRYVIWVIPSLATNIYGIAIGPVGTEVICHSPYPKKSHGINIQIGQGILLTFGIGRYKLEKPTDTVVKKSDSSYKRVIHNGILVSVFGTLTNQINGISLSSWMSANNKINGLSINPLWNLQDTLNGVSTGLVNMSRKTSGIQIGIYNKTLKLRGFQFGLWNVNERRSFPLINWNFKEKKDASCDKTATASRGSWNKRFVQ